MRILALTKYGTRAASTRQRLLQYVPALEEAGFSVELSPLFGDAHVAGIARGELPSTWRTVRSYLHRLIAVAKARRADLIWVHCDLLPYAPGPVERLIALHRRPVVVDYDDAIFHMYDAHRSRVVRSVLGNKMRSLFGVASAVIAGNAYLANYAEASNDNVFIIPTVVDTDVYRPTDRPAGERVTLGWIGSPSTWRYVEPLLPTLLPLVEELNLRFCVVGGGPAATGIAGVDAMEWTEATEVSAIQSMDIGIMPLPDAPWARGKCGYKLIQYMACGLPVIASPVGVNGEIVDDATGFLASAPAAWVAAIRQLADDRALRERLGRAGRARVVERYSLAAQAPRLVDLLRSLT